MRAICVVAAVLGLASVAEAATFTVNATLDADAPSGVTTCDDGAGHCTLRAALTASARTTGAGPDTINFNIPGTGLHTITLATPLNSIGKPVIIDGKTQPGYAGTPLIVVDGSNLAAGYNGFAFLSPYKPSSCSVSGLSLVGFPNAAIYILNSQITCTITASYIGVLPNGTAKGNKYGLWFTSSTTYPVTVGGATAADRNVISGNTGERTIVENNYIGPNPAGTVTLGATATQDGIDVSFSTTGATGTIIRNNVISGNKRACASRA
jgi:hypothetical protein